jgi:hypothetical protein
MRHELVSTDGESGGGVRSFTLYRHIMHGWRGSFARYSQPNLRLLPGVSEAIRVLLLVEVEASGRFFVIQHCLIHLFGRIIEQGANNLIE